MRPFGGTITALGFSASAILMACLYHTSKTVKKRVYASISAQDEILFTAGGRYRTAAAASRRRAP